MPGGRSVGIGVEVDEGPGVAVAAGVVVGVAVAPSGASSGSDAGMEEGKVGGLAPLESIKGLMMPVTEMPNSR